ncbi:hypothetical protein [Paenibacillus lactis]|uniref:hypothetical protein n=1 Tax=Paenibacillus lactis TaxID=228574 RepID=UPI003D71020E
MNKYNLQTVIPNGDIVAEDELVIEARDTIVFTLPENLNLEVAHNVHRGVMNALESGSPLITIPAGSKLQVLKLK